MKIKGQPGPEAWDRIWRAKPALRIEPQGAADIFTAMDDKLREAHNVLLNSIYTVMHLSLPVYPLDTALRLRLDRALVELYED